MRFQLIYPAWQKLPGQIRFDLPPLGVLQVAAAVPAGVDVGITDENVEPVDLEEGYDLVGISIMLTCQAPRAYELAREFRARGVAVVIGGLHVTLCPEEAAAHGDAVVIGESERLVPEMIADFQEGRLKKVYRSESFPDIKQLPNPRRDLHDKKRLYTYKGWELVDLVETSRGCRFNCFPCCTPYLGQRQHRTRPLEQVLKDVESCCDLIFIVDNSLEQNAEYEKELFTGLLDAGKRWISHPITPTHENLELARRSGCWYVYHAIYDATDKIRDRVQMYHDHGIGVEGTILLGLDSHTEDSIKRLIDFMLSIDLDLAELTVLTPFPQTAAHEQLEAEGRIFDRDWKNYNAATVVFEPRQIKPDKLQQLYHDAWRQFYEKESQHLRMGKLFWGVAKESVRRRKGLEQGDQRGEHRKQ